MINIELIAGLPCSGKTYLGENRLRLFNVRRPAPILIDGCDKSKLEIIEKSIKDQSGHLIIVDDDFCNPKVILQAKKFFYDKVKDNNIIRISPYHIVKNVRVCYKIFEWRKANKDPTLDENKFKYFMNKYKHLYYPIAESAEFGIYDTELNRTIYEED